MLNEFDEMDSSQLLAAYKKVVAMYEVVEEMKTRYIMKKVLHNV